VVALTGSACQFLWMTTMSIIMQTSLYLFLFQYVGFYAIEVLFSTAWELVINMDVVAHGSLHIGPEFVDVQMYLCVMLDLYQHVGMNH